MEAEQKTQTLPMRFEGGGVSKPLTEIEKWRSRPASGGGRVAAVFRVGRTSATESTGSRNS